PQGRLMPAAPLPPLEPAPVGPKSPSLWTRWWFWTVIGVAIAGATSAGIVLASDTTDHLRVWAP
ncbi:MAG TPA: hypothetical protein VKN99_25915, partial [Polyangia bacterium]|nr:hypothetical protein [Polyangia bacterium]